MKPAKANSTVTQSLQPSRGELEFLRRRARSGRAPRRPARSRAAPRGESAPDRRGAAGPRRWSRPGPLSAPPSTIRPPVGAALGLLGRVEREGALGAEQIRHAHAGEHSRDRIGRIGDRHAQHGRAVPFALGADPERRADAPVARRSAVERQLKAESAQHVLRRLDLGDRVFRRVGLGIAPEKVEDAVLAGIEPGGERRPGDRRLRRVGRRQRLVVALAREAGEIRQHALGHPALGQPRVHAVEAEHDRATGGPWPPRLHAARSRPQSLQVMPGRVPSRPARADRRPAPSRQRPAPTGPGGPRRRRRRTGTAAATATSNVSPVRPPLPAAPDRRSAHLTRRALVLLIAARAAVALPRQNRAGLLDVAKATQLVELLLGSDWYPRPARSLMTTSASTSSVRRPVMVATRCGSSPAKERRSARSLARSKSSSGSASGRTMSLKRSVIKARSNWHVSTSPGRSSSPLRQGRGGRRRPAAQGRPAARGAPAARRTPPGRDRDRRRGSARSRANQVPLAFAPSDIWQSAARG